MFGVEDSMIVVTKKWDEGKNSESESWITMIWKNEQMAICVGGDNGSESQIAYNCITHLELIERVLKEEWCTLNTQETTK